jgi:hypothetical protein
VSKLALIYLKTKTVPKIVKKKNFEGTPMAIHIENHEKTL